MPGTQVLCCKLKIARRHKEFSMKFGKREFNFIPETFRYALKKTGLFGIFSQHGGGGVFPIPKTKNQKKCP